jgi:hypothetical protein
MTEIAVIVGTAALFVGGFMAWYAAWHRRVEPSIERIPVRTRSSVHAQREGSEPEDRR